MHSYCMRCMSKLDDSGQCPNCGTWTTAEYAPHLLAPGSVLFGRYLVGRSLGQGGFGITYIGRDLLLDLPIAVKEYYPYGYANRNTGASDKVTVTGEKNADFYERGKDRFLDEARILAKYRGESGIVGVLNFFEENNTAYIVMEYLDGADLQTTLRESGAMPADWVFSAFQPIMDALRKMHSHNVFHRDVSPDNIMLLKDGTLRLMDFGAARSISAENPQTVSVMLKEGYAPEEQYLPDGNLGPWTDIYALCATMYKCITGITPPTPLQRRSGAGIIWPSALGSEMPKPMEAVLRKGLALEASDRYQSIAEMQADIHAASREWHPNLVMLHPDADAKDGETRYVPPESDEVSGHIPEPSFTQEISWAEPDSGAYPTLQRGVDAENGGDNMQPQPPSGQMRQDMAVPESRGGRGSRPAQSSDKTKAAVPPVDAGRTMPPKGTGPTPPSGDLGGKPKRSVLPFIVAALAILVGIIVGVAVATSENSSPSPDPDAGSAAAGQEDAGGQESGGSGESDEPEGDTGTVEVKTSLQAYEWSELSAISQEIAGAKDEAGALEIAKKYNLVDSKGELKGAGSKNVKVSGADYPVRIIGFFHDKKEDGSIAGITFQFENCIDEHAMNNSLSSDADFEEYANKRNVSVEKVRSSHPNSVPTNKGGWEKSEMRDWLKSTLLNKLPDDLREQIVAVDKSSNNAGETKKQTDVTTTADKLWLLSKPELVGKSQCSSAVTKAEGSKYQLFEEQFSRSDTSSDLRKFYNDEVVDWWLRSAAPQGDQYFMCVDTSGDGGDTQWADYKLGVAPCFCL